MPDFFHKKCLELYNECFYLNLFLVQLLPLNRKEEFQNGDQFYFKILFLLHTYFHDIKFQNTLKLNTSKIHTHIL